MLELIVEKETSNKAKKVRSFKDKKLLVCLRIPRVTEEAATFAFVVISKIGKPVMQSIRT